MKKKFQSKNYRVIIFLSFVVVGQLFFIGSAVAMNIDPANSFVWGENVGWINFGSAEGDVDVSPTGMDGYAWGENIGWISLNCTNTGSCATVSYGVTISGSTVAGYAWGENVGWVSFNCSNTASCGTVDYGVSFNAATGDFSGYAWGENIGWIVFNCATTGSCGTNAYKLRTTLVQATPTPDDGPSGGTGSSPPTSFTPTPGTPTPTAFPTASPIGTVTPSPTVSPTVTPGTTPSPFPTPTTPPATVTPTASPPVTPGIPPVLRLIDRIAAWLDNLIAFLFSLFGLGEVCVGSLGVAACGATAVTAIVVVAALIAALLQGEIAAIGYGMLYFFGVRHRTKVWGVVYDSRTKRPIGLVKLELLDASNRVLETRYADRDGRFGFLMSPASMHTSELHVQVRASKTGYTFPAAGIITGTDYVVYDNVYRGGMITMKGDTLLNYNIPMDPVADTRRSWSGFGRGLVGSLGDKLLAFGFYVGLVVIPLNYWFRPTTTNLVIGIVFIAVNAIRMLVLHRPYGVTTDALTGKPMPYALVTLNDLEGKRQGFAVSDEQGRFILSGEQNKDYELLAYTPANIIPQRSVRLRVRGVRRMSTRAWITNNLRI